MSSDAFRTDVLAEYYIRLYIFQMSQTISNTSGPDMEALLSALEWHLSAGADEVLADEPVNHLRPRKPEAAAKAPVSSVPARPSPGGSEAAAESSRLAAQAGTLEELREAIAAFDGLTIKKTATNMVFGAGNVRAKVMLVGEAPGADEDRIGEPFVGVSGQLLDSILKAIGLTRSAEDQDKAFYVSNILNWRPPGNRTPAPGEIEASLPFIERHIELVNPSVLVLVGGVSAKALLRRSEGISRLRRTWHSYDIKTGKIPAIATFHPSYLLRSPEQKRAAWADMLTLRKKITDIGG